ncbi:hypothetical protein E4U55_000607 [Claviceps digitariae]|nr:hypothetical protein E4U55_000607 [Claviceps digitariae]
MIHTMPHMSNVTFTTSTPTATATATPTNTNAAADALQTFCLNNPDSPTCVNVPSFYEYRPDMAANAIFLGLYAASLVGFAVTWAVTRRAGVFNGALILGLICEVLGYTGRVMSSNNPWEQDGFMMQICCLTIGPAFMAAGCYLCLRRIVAAFGPENSRLKPEYYTRLFVPCDVISLILQATGGAMASLAVQDHESPDQGSNIMVAGLAFQVFTMVAFIAASLDFVLRIIRRRKMLGEAALSQEPRLVRMRGTLRFKLFLGGLAVASVLILWRSCFRVAELSEGWSGPIMADEPMFIGFEGVLVLVAAVILNVLHPGVCARELFDESAEGREAALEKSFSDDH